MNEREEPARRLVWEWVVCGIVAAAARFVPVPLVDDAIRGRASRIAVMRTFQSRGRDYPADAVEPLHAGVQGWGAGVRRLLLVAPAKVLLFPVRKYVAIFGAVRGVPRDVLEVVLLGRAVHRGLDAGLLTGPDRAALRQDAVRIRRGYDAAISRMDLRMGVAAIRDALSQGRGLSTGAVALARRLLRSDRDPGEQLAPGKPVEQGARRVQDVLDTPELQALLADFDDRIDAALARPTR